MRLSQTSLVRNHSYENEFCLQDHFHANQTHFITMVSHLTGFETKAQGNLEMACMYLLSFLLLFFDQFFILSGVI